MDDRVRDYYIMIVAGTVTMLSNGLVWPILAPYVRDEFTAPLNLIGLSVSGYFLLRMLSEFPVGVLSDRVGPKRPLVAGRVLAIFGAFMCSRTSSIWMLILSRVLWGVGDAAFFCIGMSYVSRLFGAERRGRALGFFQAVEVIGTFIGQSLGGFVAASYGPRMNFMLSVACGVTAFLMVSFIKGVELEGPKQPAQSLVPSVKEMRIVLTPTVLVACLINLSTMVINTGLLGTILPIFALEELMISLTSYTLLVSGSTVGSVAGNLIGGFMSDRLGRRRMLGYGLGVGVVSIFGLTLFTGFVPLMAVMLFKGVFWGIVYSVIPAFIADAVPREVQGKAIGTFRTFLDLGGLLGPIIMTNLVGFFGAPAGYIYSFYFGDLILLVCLVLLIALREE